MSRAVTTAPLRCLLRLAPVAAVALAFFASIPWLRTLEDPMVMMIAEATAFVVVVSAELIARRGGRNAGEAPPDRQSAR